MTRRNVAINKSKEYMKHKAYQLVVERKFTQRQAASSLGVSLGLVNKVIHSVDKDKESDELTKLASDCHNKPFFCGDSHRIGECKNCFWGIIREPVDIRGNKTIVFDYEQQIIQAIESSHVVCLLKSRSIGATSLMLYYILYRILAKQESGNYFICAGNDFEAARGLMRKIRVILAQHNIYSDDRETVLNLLGSRIQAYPSRVASLRGWDNVRFVLVDEVDSLENSQDIRSVVEAYRVKSGADLVLISTPGRINSTMHRIFKEPQEKCFYNRLVFDYTHSLGKLLDVSDINRLKESSPSFSSEFECKFGAIQLGNVFSEQKIRGSLERAASGTPIGTNVNINQFSEKSMGIDWGATGSSGLGGGTACVVTEFSDNIVKVIDARLWVHAEYNDLLEEIRSMIRLYDPLKIYVDGSAVSFVRSVKLLPEVGENPDYQQEIKMYREMKVDWTNNMRVIPISWMKEQVSMLGNIQMLFNKNCIAVPERFDKLVTALKTCVAENMRVKDLSQFNDLVDAAMLACSEYIEVRA